jgi:hypothetical protein
MAARILTQSEYYDLFIVETQARDTSEKLTDASEGSVLDVIGGAVSMCASELAAITLAEFSKTFFASAEGAEATGAADDLEVLAVDHFGDAFARPEAQKATCVLTFSRPNADAGPVTIMVGASVTTSQDAAGAAVTFKTTEAATLSGTTVSAPAECETAGASGNVGAGTLTQLGTTLTDSSIVVTNSEAASGGTETETDAEYRQTITRKIVSLKGATLAGVRAAAEEVAGVANVAVLEAMQTVIPCDASGTPLVAAETFSVPVATVYVADEDGVASTTMLASVREACDAVRACGVVVLYAAANPVALNWTATYTLNMAGPNYAELSIDSTKITDAMRAYVAALAVGEEFDRAAANAAILAQWGAAGTDDLTAFSTTLPIADVVPSPTQKIIPGTMGVV